MPLDTSFKVFWWRFEVNSGLLMCINWPFWHLPGFVARWQHRKYTQCVLVVLLKHKEICILFVYLLT